MSAARAGGRIRFVAVEVDHPEAGRTRASVRLEWRRETFIGEAISETSAVGDMRVSALATARALEQVAGGTASFNLIGLKELHVFDHDLVAVLLHSPQLPDRRLIGTTVVGADRPRAAALAVLNATNRAIGNFAAGAGE